MTKPQCLRPKSLGGKWTSGDENKKTFFMKNEGLNIFSFNNFFKKTTFLEKMGEKNFGGHDHFLGEGVILR